MEIPLTDQPGQPLSRDRRTEDGTGVSEYRRKLDAMSGSTLLPRLEPADRAEIERLAVAHRFTFQELRRTAEIARDLEMWGEGSFSGWSSGVRTGSGDRRARKRRLLAELEAHHLELARTEKSYSTEPAVTPPNRRVKLVERATDREVLGLCAAYSDLTICCGLKTLDAVRGCAFSCSYCTIQTFYGDTAELEADLGARLAEIDLDPGRNWHIGPGQSSDSLIWGNRGGQLESLIKFAESRPNVLLELKTKSDNVAYLLERGIPENVVCAWSLNPECVIANEEHGTAPLARRLAAARSIADRGGRVAFHFHPMLLFDDWRSEYGDVARRLVATFDPVDVAFVSMGSMTLIKPVAREIRRRGGETKVLQMAPDRDPHGKLTYPRSVKIDLFSHLYQSLEPWHDEVFFYLCMETRQVWERVFGRCYESYEAFEIDFLEACPPLPSQAESGSSHERATGP